MNLRDKHIVITGGSTGVGGALATELHRRGARLTLIALEGDELRRVAAETDAAALPIDVSNFEALHGLIAQIEDTGGPVDGLVSNAATIRSGPLHRLSAEDLRRGVMTNLLAHMELNRQALPGMLERGRGSIAIVGSVSADVPMIHLASYAPAKAALAKFGIDLQREVRGRGVTVNVFILGSVPGTRLSVAGCEDPVVRFIDKRTASLGGALTPERVAQRIAEVMASDKRGAVITIPRLAAPLVQLRLLPTHLLDPFLTRPALAQARRLADPPN